MTTARKRGASIASLLGTPNTATAPSETAPVVATVPAMPEEQPAQVETPPAPREAVAPPTSKPSAAPRGRAEARSKPQPMEAAKVQALVMLPEDLKIEAQVKAKRSKKTLSRVVEDLLREWLR